MVDVAKSLDFQLETSEKTKEILKDLGTTMTSLVVQEGDSIESLRNPTYSRIIELPNGELEIRRYDVREEMSSVREEDLGEPEESQPIKLRLPIHRRILLKYSSHYQAPVYLSDLLLHIERIYDYKTRFYDFASSSSLSRANGLERSGERPVTAGGGSSSSFLSAYRGISLAEAWLDFETEQFGLISQGEMKVCRILHSIASWREKAEKKRILPRLSLSQRRRRRASQDRKERKKEFGEKEEEEAEEEETPDEDEEEEESLLEEVELFTRFVGFCNLRDYLPLPVLSVYLFIRHRCLRWRTEKSFLLSQMKKQRMEIRRRDYLQKVEQHRVLESLMKQSRANYFKQSPERRDRTRGEEEEGENGKTSLPPSSPLLTLQPSSSTSPPNVHTGIRNPQDKNLLLAAMPSRSSESFPDRPPFNPLRSDTNSSMGSTGNLHLPIGNSSSKSANLEGGVHTPQDTSSMLYPPFSSSPLVNANKVTLQKEDGMLLSKAHLTTPSSFLPSPSSAFASSSYDGGESKKNKTDMMAMILRKKKEKKEDERQKQQQEEEEIMKFDENAWREEDQDLQMPPESLVSSLIGFISCIEALRNLSWKRWKEFVEKYALLLTVWTPQSPSARMTEGCQEGKKEEKKEEEQEEGEKKKEEKQEREEVEEKKERDGEGGKGGEGQETEREKRAKRLIENERSRRENLMKAFLCERIEQNVHSTSLFESKMKQFKLLKKKKKNLLQREDMHLLLTYQETESVLRSAGLFLPGEVWKEWLDPVGEACVRIYDFFKLSAKAKEISSSPSSPSSSSTSTSFSRLTATDLLDGVYVDKRSLFRLVIDTYCAEYEEIFSIPLAKYRTAVEAKKNSSVFTRAEFQSLLRSIDPTVSFDICNRLHEECHRLREACTMDSHVTSLTNKPWGDYVEDGIPEKVFFIASFSLAHFFSTPLALQGLSHSHHTIQVKGISCFSGGYPGWGGSAGGGESAFLSTGKKRRKKGGGGRPAAASASKVASSSSIDGQKGNSMNGGGASRLSSSASYTSGSITSARTLSKAKSSRSVTNLKRSA